VQQRAPVAPGHHQQEDGAGDGQRKPAAMHQLEQVGAPEQQIDGEKAGGRQRQGQRELPA
jgi:hypothetical protein